jgi:hypothetical protein
MKFSHRARLRTPNNSSRILNHDGVLNHCRLLLGPTRLTMRASEGGISWLSHPQEFLAPMRNLPLPDDETAGGCHVVE